MLRKTIQKAAESAGLITPSLPDATKAAEEQRKTRLAAQTAREDAEQALQAGFDRSADDGEITRLEAAVASAKGAESRADARYRGAENRLQRASDVERDKVRAAAIVGRDAALAAFTKSAAEIDRLAALTAAQVQVIDELHAAFNEAKRDGVAGPVVPTSGSAMAEFALSRAVSAKKGEFIDSKPSAAELAKRVAGAVTAAVAT